MSFQTGSFRLCLFKLGLCRLCLFRLGLFRLCLFRLSFQTMSFQTMLFQTLSFQTVSFRTLSFQTVSFRTLYCLIFFETQIQAPLLFHRNASACITYTGEQIDFRHSASLWQKKRTAICVPADSRSKASKDPATSGTPLAIATSRASWRSLPEKLGGYSCCKQLVVMLFVSRCLAGTFLCRLLLFATSFFFHNWFSFGFPIAALWFCLCQFFWLFNRSSGALADCSRLSFQQLIIKQACSLNHWLPFLQRCLLVRWQRSGQRVGCRNCRWTIEIDWRWQRFHIMHWCAMRTVQRLWQPDPQCTENIKKYVFLKTCKEHGQCRNVFLLF